MNNKPFNELLKERLTIDVSLMELGEISEACYFYSKELKERERDCTSSHYGPEFSEVMYAMARRFWDLCVKEYERED